VKPVIEIIGSGSRIAKEYCKKNKEKFIFKKYSSSNQKDTRLKEFFKNKKSDTTVVAFCHIRKDQKKTINLLYKIAQHCKDYNKKLVYISSINATKPQMSHYSKVKKECEKVVNNYGFFYLQFGIVASQNPFGAYKSLLKLKKLKLNFQFQDNQKIFFSNIETINDINFSKIISNKTVIDYEKNLNNFIKNPEVKIIIYLHPLVMILRFLNKFIVLPNFLDRLLTLTAFNN
jgi:hypothetical protein